MIVHDEIIDAATKSHNETTKTRPTKTFPLNINEKR